MTALETGILIVSLASCIGFFAFMLFLDWHEAHSQGRGRRKVEGLENTSFLGLLLLYRYFQDFHESKKRESERQAGGS